jgi:hypothetical protein
MDDVSRSGFGPGADSTTPRLWGRQLLANLSLPLDLGAVIVPVQWRRSRRCSGGIVSWQRVGLLVIRRW